VKIATCLFTAFALACSTAYGAQPSTKNSIDDIEALKQGSVSGINNPIPNEGGETIATAVNIPALPYSDGGNTCDNVHDYDAVCPFTGSTSADVVYRLTGSDIDIDIDLCNSGYDTKVYVYQNNSSTLVACNDDACGSDGFRSELLCVPLSAGNTYYIVVDGYFGACGTYDMNVAVCVPCEAPCPPGGQVEGEPVCFDGYKDAYNGGCNSTPNVFSNITCDPTGNATMCGEYGGFFHTPSGFDYRDTDWYALDSSASAGASVTAVGQYPSLFGYINAAGGCGAPFFEDFLTVGQCDPANFVLGANPYWFFAATSGFGAAAGACGGDYTISLTGYTDPDACGPIAVEEETWGGIKARFGQ
jgi:hypothetical protein